MDLRLWMLVDGNAAANQSGVLGAAVPVAPAYASKLVVPGDRKLVWNLLDVKELVFWDGCTIIDV